jgi:hypothetical protein
MSYRRPGFIRSEGFNISPFRARYLDSKVGRRLPIDPALGEYIPEAPVNKVARRRNGNLPGMECILELFKKSIKPHGRITIDDKKGFIA